MKRIPYATALISVLAALVLWSVANLFEDDTRWTDLVDRSAPGLPEQQRRTDSTVKTNTSVASCEQAEEILRQRVGSAQYCVNDDDCTLFDYGYPIQCLTSVAKSEITALRLEYRNYEQSCAYRVYYDCPSGPAEREAVCHENRCEVELVTIDLLKDETLRYLGIE